MCPNESYIHVVIKQKDTITANPSLWKWFTESNSSWWKFRYIRFENVYQKCNFKAIDQCENVAVLNLVTAWLSPFAAVLTFNKVVSPFVVVLTFIKVVLYLCL